MNPETPVEAGPAVNFMPADISCGGVIADTVTGRAAGLDGADARPRLHVYRRHSGIDRPRRSGASARVALLLPLPKAARGVRTRIASSLRRRSTCSRPGLPGAESAPHTRCSDTLAFRRIALRHRSSRAGVDHAAPRPFDPKAPSTSLGMACRRAPALSPLPLSSHLIPSASRLTRGVSTPARAMCTTPFIPSVRG